MEPLPQHIRSNKTISGLQIGNACHKISLFADDVILVLTNPTSSLAEVQTTLNWFSNVSYYKLNTTKSSALDINLDATTKNLLQQQYPFTWADKEITYLGIQLTKSIRHLYSSNFLPLLHKINTDTQQIIKHKLSWSGRLAAFKMTCLPQILYFFRTLPIPILSSFFRSLHSIFNKFLWKGKKPRCAHAKLIKHRLAGGAGSIDFRDYYLAAILVQLPEWFQPSTQSLWAQIEKSSLICFNLKHWLLSTPLGSHVSPLKASVYAWKKMVILSDYIPFNGTP